MFLLWVCGACLLASCGGRRGGLLTPVSTGRPYELLVVVDPGLWERPAGREIFRALDADVPGLPQSEPSFRLMYAPPRKFDATLKLVRNILVVDVDAESCTEASFRYAEDVYAASQAILTIQAPDEESLETYVAKHGAALVRYFTQVEMRRRVRDLSRESNRQVSAKVRAMFGGDIWVPVELKASKEGKDFFWASTDKATDDCNFVMYSYPSAGVSDLTQAGFVHKRDSVMRINIPGARPGMYMATDSLMTDARMLDIRGVPVLEVRGLWRVEGDFMGGPFVAHVRLDTERKRVVVAEVFVYAPDHPKRNLMRGMEASLYTWRMDGEDEEKEEDKNETINHKE